MKATEIDLKLIETMILGSLKEFVRQKDYYRISGIGLEYCYTTEEGSKALSVMMDQHLRLLHAAMSNDEVEQAKQHMMDTLKK